MSRVIFGKNIHFLSASQMYVWAGGKKKRYRRLFGDKYKTKQCKLPFV